MNLQNKKIAMLIAQQDFRDEEYFIPKGIFEEAGIRVETFGPKKGMAIGSYGGVVEVGFVLNELKPEQFDAIIFVGGSGALKYLNTATSWQIAKNALEQGKVLAAICIAPVILAESRVLTGKKATVWNSAMDKSAVKILADRGAIFQEKPLVADGQIITAAGPAYARQFAEAIVRALTPLEVPLSS